MTGAPMPAGADAVAMVEDSERLDGDRGAPVARRVRAGRRRARRRRRRARRRHVLFAAGTVVDAGRRSACWPASTPGRSRVHPGRPRRRAVDRRRAGHRRLAAAAGPDPREQRHDAGAAARRGRLRRRRTAASSPTTRPRSRRVLRDAAATNDAIVTSGGVSMGDYDVVKAVLGRIADMQWMQIAIKPAKPFAFGLLDGTPVFGLPGNPVSSLVSFELLARPALRRMMGHRHARPHQPRRRHRRRPAPPARRQGPLRARQRRRSPTTAATTCARSAPRAATSWPPRRSPTPSLVLPDGDGSRPARDVAVLLLCARP